MTCLAANSSANFRYDSASDSTLLFHAEPVIIGCGGSKPEYRDTNVHAQPINHMAPPQEYADPQPAAYQQAPPKSGSKKEAAKNMGFLSTLAN